MAALRETTSYGQFLFFIIGFTILTLGSEVHFRGGTISWRPLGGKTFEFYFKLSWTYQRGPGCTTNTVGQFMEDPGGPRSNGPTQFWKCEAPTCGSRAVQVSSVGYICTGASNSEDWEQGERKFNYTFPSNKDGPFVIEFAGANWMKLGGGTGNGAWSLRTTVDVRNRSDIQMPNSSPVALSQAVYSKQHGCHHELQIPTFDADNDTVRCRWSQGKECASVCNALPFATLNEATCTITFDATNNNTYKARAFYGVAVTIEDYPRTNITLGSEKKTPSRALSSIPVQFLIETPSYNSPCEEKPRFIAPTPAEGSTLFVQAGDTLTFLLVADNGNDTSAKINVIGVSGPAQLTQSTMKVYQSSQNAYFKNLTWDTSSDDLGTHLVCAYASNTKGKTSDSRCFSIEIVETVPTTTVPTTTVPTTTVPTTTVPTINVPATPNPATTVPTTKVPTTAVSAIPLPLPSCLSPQGHRVNTNKDSCETTAYCDCLCFISPNDPPEEDNTMRYMLGALIGSLSGLVLSLLTTWLYYYFRRSPPSTPKARRKRSRKTGYKCPIIPVATAPSCDIPQPKPAKKMTVHDRLARRMTCTRPWCEVHRHRHKRESINSLRKIMKMIRQK